MAYEGAPASAFVDIPIVQDHLSEAAQFVAREMAENYRVGTEGVMRHTPWIQFDSPLEAIFWLWWEACVLLSRLDEKLLLKPQQEVVLASSERYRVDFLIEPLDRQLSVRKAWTPIAVEVDGHQFHERTLEQVAYRNQRDRALQQAGWKVFHFSFSEFTRRPSDCVLEVLLFARDQCRRASLTE